MWVLKNSCSKRMVHAEFSTAPYYPTLVAVFCYHHIDRVKYRKHFILLPGFPNFEETPPIFRNILLRLFRLLTGYK